MVERFEPREVEEKYTSTKKRLNHDNRRVVEETENALVKMGRKPEFIPHLIKDINTPDNELRRIVLQALGEVKTKEDRRIVIPHLLKSLSKDPHWSVKESAALSLGKLREITTLNALEKARKGYSYPVQEAAKKAIAAIKKTAEFQKQTRARKET